jgi:uncharacterized membrane protein
MATRARRHWTDRDLQVVIGNLLRAGVLIAAAVALAGGVLHLWRHGGDRPNLATFHGEPAEFRSVSGVVRAVARGDSLALIQLGVLLLLATPVARVALSLVGFWKEGDRRYVGITAVVLLLLLATLFAAGP